MKTILITIGYYICSMFVFAQAPRFITSGNITFEKTVNVYGLIKQHIGKNPDNNMLAAVDKYKETHPQFKKYSANLLFNNSESLYIPGPSPQERIMSDNNNPMAASGNLTYLNPASDLSITEKQIYDNLFIVKDSPRKIRWRYTGDTREIAGYTCRRANAIIMDSVYVVAFYTDKIHFSGGPESFSGLPGMILGVALPYENVTWFATKVTDTTIDPNTIKPPQKGKSINRQQLNEFLKNMMKDWGAVGLYEQKVYSL